METMNEIIQRYIDEGRTLNFGWRIFLDEYYRSELKTRSFLVKDEVSLEISEEEKAVIAAGVHRLTRLDEIPTPEWVYKDEYYLKKPFFPKDARGRMRLICLVESPPEYKSRNIYTSSNTLNRT